MITARAGSYVRLFDPKNHEISMSVTATQMKSVSCKEAVEADGTTGAVILEVV